MDRDERIRALEAKLKVRRDMKGFKQNVREIEAEIERLKAEE